MAQEPKSPAALLIEEMQAVAAHPEADVVANRNPRIGRDDDACATFRCIVDTDMHERCRTERLENLYAPCCIAHLGRRELDVVRADTDKSALPNARGPWCQARCSSLVNR